MGRNILWWLVLPTMSSLILFTLCQQYITVPTPILTATLWGNVTLKCDSNGTPISICTFERNRGMTRHRNWTQLFLSTSPERTHIDRGGYNFVHSKLDQGLCVLEIQSVVAADAGLWLCILGTRMGMYDEQMRLTVISKPSALQFDKPLPTMFESNGTIQIDTITCFTKSSFPRTSFEWFIGDTRLVRNLGEINQTVSSGQTYTFQELRGHRFSFKDNGKKLRCVVVHEALGDSDITEVSQRIDIRYMPRLLASDGSELSRHYRVDGEVATITFNISSQSSPKLEWEVNGEDLNELGKFAKHGIWVAPLISVATNMHKLTLILKSMEGEQKTVFLNLTNECGSTDYHIEMLPKAGTRTGYVGLLQPPVGFVYPQYDGEASPESLWPDCTWGTVSPQRFQGGEGEDLILWKQTK